MRAPETETLSGATAARPIRGRPWFRGLRPRSISLRLTLLNALLFTLFGGVLLFFVAWTVGRFMQAHFLQSIDAELAILSSEWKTDGAGSLGLLIAERLRTTSGPHERVYRFESRDGTRKVGNLDAWPPSVIEPGRRYDLGPMGPDRAHVHARFASMPDGSRLLVGFGDGGVREVLRSVRAAVLWGLLLTLVLAVVMSHVLTRAPRRHLRAILGSAHRIMSGEPAHRIERSGTGDEFDALAETLNEMLDRIDSGVAAIRSATDNIAHDLRTPLSIHRANLEKALRNPPSPSEFERWVRDNLAEVDHILAIFSALLRLATIESRAQRTGFRTLALDRIVRDACEMYEPVAAALGVQLEWSVSGGALMAGDRDLLFQAVANLLDNALKAAPRPSVVSVSLECRDGRLLLRVTDGGSGIPDDLREKVFERLYRGDASRLTPGTGLGLSIVRAVARLHRGDCRLEARPDPAPGTTAVLDLPAERRGRPREERPPTPDGRDVMHRPAIGNGLPRRLFALMQDTRGVAHGSDRTKDAAGAVAGGVGGRAGRDPGVGEHGLR